MKIANKQLEIQMVTVHFVNVEQAGFNHFVLSPKK